MTVSSLFDKTGRCKLGTRQTSDSSIVFPKRYSKPIISVWPTFSGHMKNNQQYGPTDFKMVPRANHAGLYLGILVKIGRKLATKWIKNKQQHN